MVNIFCADIFSTLTLVLNYVKIFLCNTDIFKEDNKCLKENYI